MFHPKEGLASAENILAVGLAFLVIVMVILIARWWASRKPSFDSFRLTDPPKDIVILHQYGHALTVPSISPFVMKLETYLRAAKIKYINKYSRKPGPKGKLPWIQYNDHIVPDSQFCIQFLNAQRNIDLNKKLASTDLAIGHLARRTAEESLYWTLLMWRLVFERTGNLYKRIGVPSIFIWYMRRVARPSLWAQGIGRHSLEEVTQIMEDDLRAISQILGSKKFLFGDDVNDVTEFDCALFGQLSQLVWQMPGTPVQDILAEKFPNLVGYCTRMKAAFWPDWDERLLNPPRKPDAKEE